VPGLRKRRRVESARIDHEPPGVAQHSQDAVRWLSRAIIALEQDSHDAPEALADTLAGLLTALQFDASPAG
jgi:hypothetical protein